MRETAFFALAVKKGQGKHFLGSSDKSHPWLYQSAEWQTRFATCYKINRLARSILPTHPCAGEGLNFSDPPLGGPVLGFLDLHCDRAAFLL